MSPSGGSLEPPGLARRDVTAPLVPSSHWVACASCAVLEKTALQMQVHELRETLIVLWVSGDTINCLVNEVNDRALLPTTSDYMRASKWCSNAGIIDEKGKPLRAQDFPLFRSCSLMQLRVREESPGVFLLSPPRGSRPFALRHYQQLRRWCASIFACVPATVWRSQLLPIRPRNFPALDHQYCWHVQHDGSVIATNPSEPGRSVLRLAQDPSGWTWSVSERDPSELYDRDVQALKFEQAVAGLAFEPTPYLHPTPWTAPRSTTARGLRQTIRKSRSKRLKRQAKFSVQHVLDKMAAGAAVHAWCVVAQMQQPQQIWQHDGVLTDFQRWTTYRICTRTLNLFHGGWPSNRRCSNQLCQHQPETIEHILWYCSRAQEVWESWLPQWTGHYLHREELTALLPHVASRTAPSASAIFLAEATKSIDDWGVEYEDAMRIIWLIWTTSTQCVLWTTRNREIFDKETVTIQEVKRSVRKSADFQTKAVIRGMTSYARTQAKGFRLAQYYAVFTALVPSERPVAMEDWYLLLYDGHVVDGKSRRGAWVLFGSCPPEIEAVGFVHLNQAQDGADSTNKSLERAMNQLKQRAVLSTVRLTLQGTFLRTRGSTALPVMGVGMLVRKPLTNGPRKAVKALVKSRQLARHSNAVLLKSDIPQHFTTRLENEMKTGSSDKGLQDHNSIRNTLQRFQDSIVSR